MPLDAFALIILFAAGFWAGAQNAVAGGGPLITLPVLMLTGLDARIANLTSTVALFPGQIATGFAARNVLRSTGGIPVRMLLAINLLGGASGALLLLLTPSDLFQRMVPWLVMFATLIYAWSGFAPRGQASAGWIGPVPFAAGQLGISIYGGYFGGGNSFIMLAILSLTGLGAREAGGLKNLLIALINAAAICVFLFSSSVAYRHALILGAGAAFGSLAGIWMLGRLNETALRMMVVLIGILLTSWLFWSR